MVLPIVYLTGATAVGKGTLGKKLAAEFNFHHVSLGDIRRSIVSQLHAGAPGMDVDIRRLIIQRETIPSSILARFDPVPAILKYHNQRVSGPGMEHSWSISVAMDIIDEVLAEIRDKGTYRAIIIDGHPLTSGGGISDGFVEQRIVEFSGLTIMIECPREEAKKRFVARARIARDTAEGFEIRMKRTEKALRSFVELMEGYGEVVRFTNSDAMTVDEAYESLVEKLRQSRIEFIEKGE